MATITHAYRTTITSAYRYADDAPDDPNAESVLLADGEPFGGAYPCIANPARQVGWGHDDGGLSGDSWSSWGPRGLSCGHPTREAAEQAQIDAWQAQHPVICPRCKRGAFGWPVKRADVCSPRDWVNCIRDPEAILAAV